MRDAGHVVVFAGRICARQIQMIGEDFFLEFRQPLFALGHARLDDAQFNPGDDAVAGVRQPPGSKGPNRKQWGNSQRKRQARPALLTDRHKRAGKNDDSGDRQRVNTGDRRTLHETVRARQSIAQDIPRQSGQQMSAQPLRDAQRDSKRQDARNARTPK